MFLWIPKAIFAVVVLPDPFGPIKVTIFPFSICKETSFTSHLLFWITPAFSNFTRIFFLSFPFMMLTYNICYIITLLYYNIMINKFSTFIISLFTAVLFTFSNLSADIKVVASIKPIHSLVSYVMDGIGKPALIVDGSNSPHNFNMKPSNAKDIENADIIFWVGEDIESFLEKPLKSISKKQK